MKEEKTNKHLLFFLYILVLSILGGGVFLISQKIQNGMSSAAIQNLSENLDLIKGTIEGIVNNEAEFQKLIARKIVGQHMNLENYQDFDDGIRMITKVSVILPGESEGISSTGDVFTEEEMDFSSNREINGMTVSNAYINYMGEWAYTMKCPMIMDDREIGTLYAEYTYSYLDELLPKGFYNKQAILYIMDTKTKRFVLCPKGMGERNAGHLNLEDFYRANNILDERIRTEIKDCVKNGENIMFYHDIQGKNSLNFIWMMNEGTIALIGYVPVEVIQKEGKTVSYSIFVVVAIMISAFVICVVLHYLNQRQQRMIMKERQEERERYNEKLLAALQEAQIANNAKTTFLSNMSHDIRTPMNAVLGFATLLEREAENPGKVREYTGKIMASGKYLLNLINDILDVSKIESGKIVLVEEAFSFKELITSAEDVIRPLANAKEQSFCVEITNIKHDYLLGDDTRIHQVLINLLSNAVKYTPEKGNIWLRVSGLDAQSEQFEHIRIEVEDNGYGMTQEYLKTIFDAFTRAENSMTNKIQGTGLGMAITKSIVDLMGGSCEVFSEVDKGSLFRVEIALKIPEACGDAYAESELPESGEESSLEGLHFLAAEDNEINAEILLDLLSFEGASCELVENGKLALERFAASEENEFDAILMDVQMPVMNGYDAAREIRKLTREDAARIPIIAMTANAFVEDKKEALRAGMNIHLAKPLDMELLKKAVSQYVRREASGN